MEKATRIKYTIQYRENRITYTADFTDKEDMQEFVESLMEDENVTGIKMKEHDSKD